MKVFLSIIRFILRMPSPQVGRDEALSIASKTAESKDLKVSAPLVVERLRTWEIWLDRNIIGSPIIIVDQQTGEVIKVAIIPR